jgi:hypothetical protein
MQFDQLLCGPKWSDLRAILRGGSPTLVTAYYGGGMLRRMAADAPAGIQLLVRMPVPSMAIPKVLPNDPTPLLAFMKRRTSAQVFASSSIHAKIFVSDAQAIIGSANLSGTGFSGAAEACLSTTDTGSIAILRTAAQDFIAGSEAIDQRYVRALVAAVEAGQSSVSVAPDATLASQILEEGQAGNPSFDSFKDWLGRQKRPEARELLEYANGRNNMSGHVYTGYHGLCLMFRMDPGWARTLISKNWMAPSIPHEMQRISGFVGQNPGLIRGKVSAVWEDSYLPRNLGGSVGGGGAGEGVLRRMMTLIPRFLRELSLI